MWNSRPEIIPNYVACNFGMINLIDFLGRFLKTFSIPTEMFFVFKIRLRVLTVHLHTWLHNISYLDAVLQAVQLPAGVAYLNAGLADVDGEALSHGE